MTFKALTVVTMKIRVQRKFLDDFLKRFAFIYFNYPHVKTSAAYCCDMLLSNEILNVAIISNIIHFNYSK